MEQVKSIDVQSLFSKPLWQMSGEEFCALTRYASAMDERAETQAQESAAVNRKLAKGIHELSQDIGCCDTTVYVLKKNGILDPAIVSRIGRSIVFDVEKARELAEKYQSLQRDERRAYRDKANAARQE